MLEDRVIIDKKYVHKIKDENVFLCNLRRMVPLIIEKHVFDTVVKNTINEEEYALLVEFYKPYTPSRGNNEKKAQNHLYAIRYLPAIQYLSEGEYTSLLAEKKNHWEKELIASLYVRQEDGEGVYYQLIEDIAEPFDNFLVSSLKAWDLFVNYEEKTYLSAIMEKVPLSGKRNIFLANMFINTGHPFFFEHPNDHVPAIMLIETVRQFLLACSHQFGKVPFADTQIIINSMSCRFTSYVNMNYPVLFRSTTISLKTNRRGFWKCQEVLAEVFQGGKRLAEFRFTGNCIDSNLFSYIREDQIAELKQSRFIPLSDKPYRLHVRAAGSGRQAEATLVNLSMEGIGISVKGGAFDEKERLLDITLDEVDGQTIRGRYRIVWHSDHFGETVYGLRSVKMEEKDLEALHALICRQCIVEERREFV
ncbi:MAG: PilZ domain-containing protein [Spirochaetales bacterium]|nr:PilZ domain-containing protein [Spirochaetales bacterium]